MKKKTLTTVLIVPLTRVNYETYQDSKTIKLGYVLLMFYPPLISKLGGKNQTYETQSECISTNQHDCDHDSIIICKISKAEYI